MGADDSRQKRCGLAGLGTFDVVSSALVDGVDTPINSSVYTEGSKNGRHAHPLLFPPLLFSFSAFSFSLFFLVLSDGWCRCGPDVPALRFVAGLRSDAGRHVVGLIHVVTVRAPLRRSGAQPAGGALGLGRLLAGCGVRHHAAPCDCSTKK